MLDLDQRRREFEAELLRKPRRRSNTHHHHDHDDHPAVASSDFQPIRFKERAWKGEEEETWRTTYRRSAQEAAEWGRLTRLREQVVEGPSPTSNVSQPLAVVAAEPIAQRTPTKQLPPRAVVDPLAIVQDAARVGAATRLPEKIVRNYEKSDDDDDKTAEYAAPTTLRSAPYLHSSVDEVVLPTKAPSAVQKLRAAAETRRHEIVVRPMVELSRQVAFAAWQRDQRLQKTSGGHNKVQVRTGCPCEWCQTSSPFQTHAYRQLVRNPQQVKLLQEPSEPRSPVPKVVSPQVARVREADGGDDESSGYTEITVSTNDEQFYPVIECEPMDERRTSDITFEEASLLLRLHLDKLHDKEDKPVGTEPGAKDGACGSTANTTAQTSRTTKSSSQPVPTTVRKTKKPLPHAAPAKLVPRDGEGRAERRVEPTARAGPPLRSAPKAREVAAAPTPRTRLALENRRRAPMVRRRERPNVQYVVTTKASEDVSTLSLPGYFEDKVERAILDQMYKPIAKGSSTPSAAGDPSACRVTRFLQAHFGVHK